MIPPLRPICCLLLLGALGRTAFAQADTAAGSAPKKILFFSKSSGYEHRVIAPPGAPVGTSPGNTHPGLALEILRALGAKNGIAFTFSKDGSLFSPAYLDQFDAYFFYTTGDLTETGTDGQPAMTLAGKRALLEAVRHGKGFIGVHSASDTFHSPGNKESKAPERFQADGDKADDYIKMLGGEFIRHGKQQPSHLIVIDPHFPGIALMSPRVAITEEWYSLKDFAPDLHVLLVQDTTGMTGPEYARPNYPSTWIRRHGQGRVFYTNLGHRDDMWQSARYQALLLGAIRWTTGQVEADLTPNLSTAAPQAQVLPHYVKSP